MYIPYNYMGPLPSESNAILFPTTLSIYTMPTLGPNVQRKVPTIAYLEPKLTATTVYFTMSLRDFVAWHNEEL